MLDLTNYITSYDEVRLLLGLNSDELTDNDIDNATFIAQRFTVVVEAIHADLAADALVDTGVFESLSTFAVYFTASKLLGSLPGLMPKQVTDGKASISRFSASPYEKIAQHVYKGLSESKIALTSVYETYKSITVADSTVDVTHVSVAVPDLDPIAGE